MSDSSKMMVFTGNANPKLAQDVANVVNAATGVTSVEVLDDGDLYVSVTLPSLTVGTVGGGTGLGTSRECLEMLGCFGSGAALKFTEIVAATVLAGELSIGAAIASGEFVAKHEAAPRGDSENQIQNPFVMELVAQLINVAFSDRAGLSVDPGGKGHDAATLAFHFGSENIVPQPTLQTAIKLRCVARQTVLLGSLHDHPTNQWVASRYCSGATSRG